MYKYRYAILLAILLVCCHRILADNNVLGNILSTTIPSTSTGEGPTADLTSSLLWILIAGFVLAFILSFGVGANDVANVFGTSVGAKVVTLRQACCIATVAEVLGACLLGYKVSDTVRKGILDVTLYNNTEKELMLGSLAALGGSSLWNLLATFLKLPISGTHTIVGATVGFSLCARGTQGVNWLTFGKIVASWFVSPVLSGLMSMGIYFAVRKFILSKDKPLEPGLRSLPFFYGFTILVNIFSIVHDGPDMLYLSNLPLWISLTFSVLAGVLVGLFVQCIVVPRQRREITVGLRDKQYVQFTIGSAGSMRNSQEGLATLSPRCVPYDSGSRIVSFEKNSRSPTPPGELSQLEKGLTTVNPTSYPLLSVNHNGYLPVPDKNHDALALFDSDITEKENFKNAKLDKLDGELPDKNSQIPLVSTAVSNLSSKVSDKADDQDSYEVSKLFSFLQILTATFGSFAHGGNDVSNAIGPLIALWAIYNDGTVHQQSEPPIYILLYGGLGISVGLWIWGRRVIQTIGEDLTKVTPSSGFTIEIGSAFTVLLASKIGLPISTTHCKVGSVVFVGWCKSSKEGVDWSLFRNIVIAWVVTVPLTALVSAFLMYIFRLLFL